MEKIRIFTVLALFLLKSSICEEADRRISYDLVTDDDSLYNYVDYKIISETNTSTITVTSELPVLEKGMLDLEEEVEFMEIRNVNLTEIEPGVFENQNLTFFLSFQDNKLTIIKSGTFCNFDISALDLSYNKISHIEEGAIADMPYLENLDLSHNEIVHFHENYVDNTPYMSFFDISYNKLRKLEKRCFTFFGKSEAVIFIADHNEIAKIDPKVFDGYGVVALSLDYNKIRKIPGEIFEKGDMEYVRLEGNELTDLPKTFFKQKYLESVELMYNSFNCDVQKKLRELSINTKAKILYKYSIDC